MLQKAGQVTSSSCHLEVFYGLIRASGCYVNEQGRFQPELFNRTLAMITREHLQAVMTEMNEPARDLALFFLLSASAPKRQ